MQGFSSYFSTNSVYRIFLLCATSKLILSLLLLRYLFVAIALQLRLVEISNDPGLMQGGSLWIPVDCCAFLVFIATRSLQKLSFPQ
ncbi:hypothetical protein HDF15_003552 [Granulicella mallensis]|uniref:Uncharacterized protein n=1 Tax=Granulicella mallensis TaxID=940614 RepID=A0A7W7ZSY5_9BACT|nr:hypothetical protein [Granulicella mallensis]